MALPSTSFQPPLPSETPAPPACPPPPPLPPSEPPEDSMLDSLPTPAGAPMTVQPYSARVAEPLAASSPHSAPTFSHLPYPQCVEPTSAAPLPRGATSDKISSKMSHAGERAKPLTTSSKSKSSQPSETPVVR